MTKMALMPIYGKNPSKNLLLWNRWTDFHETWYVASMTPAHHSLFKWWSWVDLDLFYGKVKIWELRLFYRKKWKLLIFQNFCSQWPGNCIKIMKICDYWRSRSFLDLDPKSVNIWNLKLAFLRNHWANQSQILYVSFQVQGNENLLTLMLVTWPKWLPRPYVVKTLQKSSYLRTDGPISTKLGM